MSSVVFAEKGHIRKGERSTQLPRIISFSTDLRRVLGDAEHLCVKREGKERATGCERCRKKMESIEKRNQSTNIDSFHFLSAPRRGTSLPSSASRREGERSWSLSSAEAKREGDERETEREREAGEARVRLLLSSVECELDSLFIFFNLNLNLSSHHSFTPSSPSGPRTPAPTPRFPWPSCQHQRGAPAARQRPSSKAGGS